MSRSHRGSTTATMQHRSRPLDLGAHTYGVGPCRPGDECSASILSNFGIATAADLYTLGPTDKTRGMRETSEQPSLEPPPGARFNPFCRWSALNASFFVHGINTAKRDVPIVFLLSAAVPVFAAAVVPRLQRRFVLVTGIPDCTVPHELFARTEARDAFLNDPRLVHWFAVHGDSTHPKFSGIPHACRSGSHTTKQKAVRISLPLTRRCFGRGSTTPSSTARSGAVAAASARRSSRTPRRSTSRTSRRRLSSGCLRCWSPRWTSAFTLCGRRRWRGWSAAARRSW